MMKLNKLIRVAYILPILVSFSFTSSNNAIPETPERENESIVNMVEFEYFLTGWHSKKWTASSFTIAGFTQSCRLDDEFVFKANKTYEYNAGAEPCGDSSSDNSKTGTWQVSTDGKSLTFDRDSEYEYTADIIVAQNGALELKGFYYLLPIRGKYTN